MRVQRFDATEVQEHVDEVRRVHAICFPAEAPTKTASTADEDADGDGALEPRRRETDPEFWDRVTACHDEGDVLWFLLFRDEPRRDGKNAGKGEDDGAGSRATRSLIGFAAAVPYAKSVYGMHLAVVPSQRGRGYGAWLMHEVQAWALGEGYVQLQASVEAAHVRLLRYYQHLGARIVPTGMGSGGSAPATVGEYFPSAASGPNRKKKKNTPNRVVIVIVIVVVVSSSSSSSFLSESQRRHPRDAMK